MLSRMQHPPFSMHCPHGLDASASHTHCRRCASKTPTPHLVSGWDWCFRSSVSWCNVAGASQCVSSPIRAPILWDTIEVWVTHNKDQGEGAEQGDPMMPLLFSLGLHARDELIFAFLDDIYLKLSPDRVAPVYALLQQELWRHARIRVHDGKTQVWNRAGLCPAGCDVLESRSCHGPQFHHGLARVGVASFGTGHQKSSGHLSDTKSLSATI